MPVRISKTTRKNRQIAQAAHLYARRFDPDAYGVAVHTYRNGAAYLVEIVRANGTTLAVNTLSEAELLSSREPDWTLRKRGSK